MAEQVFKNVWCEQSRRQRKHFLTERKKAVLPKTSEMHLFFFFFHLVGNQQGEDVSSYLLGLPAFLLLRRNSGEVYAPALEKKKKSLLNIKAITKKHKNTYFSYHNIIMITQEQVNVKMNHEVIFFPLGQSMMVHSDLFHSKFIYTMVGEI